MLMNSLVRRAAAVLALCLSCSAYASGTGTLSLTQKSLTYSGGPYVVPKPAYLATALTGTVPTCAVGSKICDVYQLTVQLPADYAVTNPGDAIAITVSWASTGANFDVFVYDQAGVRIAQSATTLDPEVIRIPALGGTHRYQVQTLPSNPQAQSIRGQIALVPGAPTATNVSLGGAALDVLVPPEAFRGYDAGEPTIGVIRSNDHALFMAGTSELRAVFNDATSPADTAWTDITDPTSRTTLTFDPFITVDPYPRADGGSLAIVAQLHETTSVISRTKDEGASWTTSVASGVVNGEDHESIFIGPYPAGLRPKTALAEHALYYCSHALVNAFCSRSDTGGVTFNPGVPIWPAQIPDYVYCSHGMVKVGADGTVYVPAAGGLLGGSAAVTLSVDAGLTWHFVPIPSGVSSGGDPSIAIARDGKTLYFAYVDWDHSRPAVLKGTLDKTDPLNPTIDWDPSGAVMLDAPVGIKNASFPTAIAGDANRAAVAFHGTTTAGFSNDAVAMANAAWYLYVATTLDGGKTWRVNNATPNDPTQRGAICQGGLTAGCGQRDDRNLLDFIHATIDSKGRILVAYADGCTDACALPGGAPNYSSMGSIARQVGGRPLYAAFDPLFAEPAVPKAPLLQGQRAVDGIALGWSKPYARGAAITGYRLYRGEIAGGESYLGQFSGNSYLDAAADPTIDHYYRVTAMNALGESVRSNEIKVGAATLDGSPCVLPGVVVAREGGNSGGVQGAGLHIEYAAIGEPYFDSGKDAVVFTLKVDTLANPPPQTRWAIMFEDDGTTAGQNHYVAMTTDGGGTQFTYGLLGPYLPGGFFAYRTLGNLDASSGYSANGEIVMVLPRAAFPGLRPGKQLTGIFARLTVETVTDPVSRPSSDADGWARADATAPYHLIGNAACKP